VFTETLSKNTKEALALLGKSGVLKDAYLGGGTAAALQLGHRISIDLDFFTSKRFDANKKAKALKELGNFSIEQISWGTLQGYFKKVRFSLFVYEYPVLFHFKIFHNIRVLDIRDIGAMKIAAISDRGVKRDFIDLYFICKEGIPLSYLLKLYDRKYKKLKINLVHIQKSLVYFDDAEKDEMPRMIRKVSWEDIKKFFENEVRKLIKF